MESSERAVAQGIIEIGGQQAHLVLNGDFSWACDDAKLEARLNEFRVSAVKLRYLPNPPRDITQLTANHFGAKIIQMPPARSMAENRPNARY